MNFLSVNSLLQVLGSFWTKIFVSTTFLKAVLRGQLSTHAQAEQAVSELVLATANAEIPAGKVTVWHKMVFSIYTLAAARYGVAGSKYGTSYFYGLPDRGMIRYGIDSDILAIPFLYNSPVAPTKIFTSGIDYSIVAGGLVFRSPLDYTTATTLYAKGVVREAGFTTSRLGYAINVQLADAVYRDVPFKHIWRLYTYGPNYLDLMKLLGACSSTPIVSYDEVVQQVVAYGALTLVITDHQAYCLPTAKAIALTVNQVLPQGTPLTTGVQILHDRSPYLSNSVAAVYRGPGTFQYGTEAASSTSVTLIRADIVGSKGAALKVLKGVLPADVKVIIYTNIDIPSAQINVANFSVQCNATLARKVLPALVDTQISVKTSAVVKYTHYGY